MVGCVCRGKTNFFEKRVADYQKSGVMAGLQVGDAAVKPPFAPMAGLQPLLTFPCCCTTTPAASMSALPAQASLLRLVVACMYRLCTASHTYVSMAPVAKSRQLGKGLLMHHGKLWRQWPSCGDANQQR